MAAAPVPPGILRVDVAHPGDRRPRFLKPAAGCEPPRRVGHHVDAGDQRDAGHGAEEKHRAPRFGEREADDVGAENAERDRELIDRDQHAPPVRRGVFGNVERRDDRGEANGKAEDEAREGQHRYAGCKGGEHRAQHEQRARHQQRAAPAERLGEPARHQRAEQRPERDRGGDDAFQHRRDRELAPQQVESARDHPFVEAEQETRHPGDGCDQVDHRRLPVWTAECPFVGGWRGARSARE
jgi:hypothetical protein